MNWPERSPAGNGGAGPNRQVSVAADLCLSLLRDTIPGGHKDTAVIVRFGTPANGGGATGKLSRFAACGLTGMTGGLQERFIVAAPTPSAGPFGLRLNARRTKRAHVQATSLALSDRSSLLSAHFSDLRFVPCVQDSLSRSPILMVPSDWHIVKHQFEPCFRCAQCPPSLATFLFREDEQEQERDGASRPLLRCFDRVFLLQAQVALVLFE